MATPRHLLVDPVNECDYHLVSRCVRRAFLCGVDGDRDFSHRRAWLVQRLGQIAPCFAVDVYAYTVLSNHFHLALRHDPLAHRGWSDEEVARRWVEAFPPTERGEVVEALKPERRELILDNADRVACARRTLGSMSHFMKHLKQPIARRANLEDDRTGHFFEQRFYSGALLDRGGADRRHGVHRPQPGAGGSWPSASRRSATRRSGERLNVNSAEALADYLRPVVSGLDDRSTGQPSPRRPRAVVSVESQRRRRNGDVRSGRTSRPGASLKSDLARPAETRPGAGGSPAMPGSEAPEAESHGGDSVRARPAPEPGGRARASAPAAASPLHPGGVRRPGAGHGGGGCRAVGGPSGRGEPVAGPDDGAPQAAARVRRRAGAPAMA